MTDFTLNPSAPFNRPSGRRADQLRDVRITRHYTKHAEGSVLVEFGDTHVLCTASSPRPRAAVPAGQGRGLGHGRIRHAAARHAHAHRPRGRARQAERPHAGDPAPDRPLAARRVRPEALGERTITLDCDVLQADGGTRTAAITGACVARARRRRASCWPPARSTHRRSTASSRRSRSASYDGTPVLDLDYVEDSACDTDMNVVMTGAGHFVEVQGTAEGVPFSRAEMNPLLDLAQSGIETLIAKQKTALELLDV